MDAKLRSEGSQRLGPSDAETWQVLVEGAGRAGTPGLPDHGPALSGGPVVCASAPSGSRRHPTFPGLCALGVGLALGRVRESCRRSPPPSLTEIQNIYSSTPSSPKIIHRCYKF
ncbi:transmembrane protein 267 isoform X2 [Marmota flaviventris]|uniref:transmembrane protein 267 isoform X2 n=1 Tax=Marmota flaviventris TaxID=93162 RepID=UPI000FFFB35D|nr:transmembrane protein 267 isoform X2 [Marmota flaviventris]